MGIMQNFQQKQKISPTTVTLFSFMLVIITAHVKIDFPTFR